MNLTWMTATGLVQIEDLFGAEFPHCAHDKYDLIHQTPPCGMTPLPCLKRYHKASIETGLMWSWA
jgi:hypothetical protein